MAEGEFVVRVPVSPIVLATVAANLYDIEGRTHDEVTAWLDERCTGWREVLTEIVSESGARRWMLMPSRIVMHLRYGDVAPPVKGEGDHG